ncbi:MAG: cupin domain-containing protein [Lewinellaceae bacterium]|nr:cupin domain-containing protein [Lewinellaceae bacterium]
MIYPTRESDEFHTEERCHIIEIMNTAAVDNLSVARARVEPGIITALHTLEADEYYYILEGAGEVEIDGSFKSEVAKGDLVRIRSGQTQRIRNTADSDLLFLCICTPRFRQESYTGLE